ncbi:MAG: hypothetical protein AAFN41_10600, partial [Planctomycetota bacterium]
SPSELLTTVGDMMLKLALFISPVGDDQESAEGAMAVSRCVAVRVREEWRSSERAALSELIDGYAQTVSAWEREPQPVDETSSADILERLRSIPQPSDALREELVKLTPFVLACEERLDARVAF